jgi:hypothetical protein
MNELITALFTFIPVEYVAIITLLFYVLSHVVQYLPVSVTSKVPDWVMVIINVIASKHGADKAAKTDIKGNAK